ncbi:protein psiD-like isoform X2 [Dreissena polymorpha]|uniref:protein psiD-like isoform X2 n=1 Tax=Dreissena polymorpha TaxID=45954 RepID=UPI00226450E5|nr:protein psiD-like isoform X2 [Dreissena polymorpha]
MMLNIIGYAFLLHWISYTVHPVETVSCRKDSDCHCQGNNFHAICHQNGHGQSHCGCDPTYCDPNPCPSSQICVVDQDSSVFRCREPCIVQCPVGKTCIIIDQTRKCIDPCVPNPCSSAKTCAHTNISPFYVCEAPHTTQSTTRPTDPPTTKEPSTSRTTHPSTTGAASTSSPLPTPTPLQSDCSEFNITLHGCRDSSACLLPHILEVLCPDPQQAKYCPTKCGCCQPTFIG